MYSVVRCVLCVSVMQVPRMLAQQKPLRICTVQPKEGFGSETPGMQKGWGGMQARRMAEELSKQKLGDGRPVIGVPIILKTRTEAQDEALRQNCDFTMEFWWHTSVDDVDTNSPAFIPSPPQRGNLMGDQTVVEFSLTGIDRHKVLLRGSSPPPTHYRGSDYATNPYALFAGNVLRKINQLQSK